MSAADFLMPVDVHGRWAQALAPAKTLTLAISATSNGDWIPDSRKEYENWLKADHIIQVTATEDCYLTFGLNSATATSADMLFLNGTAMYKVPVGCNFIAAITKDGNAASLSVTVMQ